MGLMANIRSRRARFTDAVRTRLWPVPVIGVALAIAAGLALPELDAAIDGHLPTFVSDFLFGGGPGTAQQVLGSVASSLITVTSLTFSLTLVTLQLASSQFSPRLLRTFVRDRTVQRTLGLFLATFAYALTVLRTVRDGTVGGTIFVPKISVTVAYVLAVVSVVALVFFLSHLVSQIRVETMLRTVSADARATGRTLFDDLDSEGGFAGPLPSAPPSALRIPAASTGFITTLDVEGLLLTAIDADAVVLVDRMAGDWLIKGTPVAFAWPAGPDDAIDDDRASTLRNGIASAIETGSERTPIHDIGYGLRQLTDVAIKALSPGINDPTTAVHALGHSCALLCELAGRRLGPSAHCDDDGEARLVIRRPDFAALLDLAVSQPKGYGSADASVISRLFWLLREVAWCSQLPAHRAAVANQLDRLRTTIATEDFDLVAREGFDRLAQTVEDALREEWDPRPVQ